MTLSPGLPVSSRPVTPTRAGMCRPRDRMAVCEVGPPSAVMTARTSLKSMSMTSAGERSWAARMPAPAAAGRAQLPARHSRRRRPTALMSCARSRR